MKYTERLNNALAVAIESSLPGTIVINKSGFALKYTEIVRGVEKKRTRSGKANGVVKYVSRFQKSWNEIVRNGWTLREARVEKDGYIIRFLKNGRKTRRIEGSFLRDGERYVEKKRSVFSSR
jgi:hypothetical protein